MTDVPIIFSASMVRALLEGRKTMTRRLAGSWRRVPDPVGKLKLTGFRPTPWTKVKPGDRLWVRENLACAGSGVWRYAATDSALSFEPGDPHASAAIAWAHHKETAACSSIHMPRWASRLTLGVTATKIERLQEISEADALAEGIYRERVTVEGREIDGYYGFYDDAYNDSAQKAFECLWCGLHGCASWDENPEVVVLSFAVHKTNVDQMEAA